MQETRYYPGEIERIANLILEGAEEIRVSKRQVEREKIRLRDLVAERSKSDADERLTNKLDRDNALSRYMVEDEGFLQAEDALGVLERTRGERLALQKKIQDLFAVAKLELRREIVQSIRARRMDDDEIDDLVSANSVFHSRTEF